MLAAASPLTAEELAASLPAPPKDLDKNLKWRAWAREYGSAHPIHGEAFRIRAWNDPAFFFDGFVWTNDEHLKAGYKRDCPMILVPVQEDVVRDMAQSIRDQEPRLWEKSRDQGLSWMAMGEFVRQWALDPDGGDMLVGSQKEEKVDAKRGTNPLLPKCRWIINRMPAFLLPEGFNMKKHSVFMAISRPDERATIQGEANNPEFGRSGRYKAVGLDEHAAMKDADVIQDGVAGAAKCYWSISTAKGRATYQYQLRESGNVIVRRIHWTQNPLTSKGMYQCERGCDIHRNGGMPHSEWFDRMAKVLNNDPIKVAQELEIDYGKAGGPVIPAELTDRILNMLRENRPQFRYFRFEWVNNAEIVTDDDSVKVDNDDQAGIWNYLRRLKNKPFRPVEGKHGPLRVWKMPFSCRNEMCPCEGTGIHPYVIGGDCAKGELSGDFDCLFVLDCYAGQVVAELHGRFGAVELIEQGYRLSRFYGSWSHPVASNAPCAIEANDQGVVVNRGLDMMGIRLVVTRAKRHEVMHIGKHTLGCYVGQNKVKLILGYLVPALTKEHEKDKLPLLVVPFPEFWQEARTFQWLELPSGRETMGCPKNRNIFDDRIMTAQHTIFGAFHFRGDFVNVKPDKALVAKALEMRRMAA